MGLTGVRDVLYALELVTSMGKFRRGDRGDIGVW